MFHPVGIWVLIPYNLPITRAAQYLRTYTYKLCTAIASIFIHTETTIVLAEDRVGDINEYSCPLMYDIIYPLCNSTAIGTASLYRPMVRNKRNLHLHRQGLLYNNPTAVQQEYLQNSLHGTRIHTREKYIRQSIFLIAQINRRALL
jgi:hypothetical protein